MLLNTAMWSAKFPPLQSGLGTRLHIIMNLTWRKQQFSPPSLPCSTSLVPRPSLRYTHTREGSCWGSGNETTAHCEHCNHEGGESLVPFLMWVTSRVEMGRCSEHIIKLIICSEQRKQQRYQATYDMYLASWGDYHTHQANNLQKLPFGSENLIMSC